VLLAAALGLGAVYALLGGERTADLLEPGRAAPAFALPVLGASGTDGGVEPSRLALDELRGRVVLINFWATWCKPCEDEMPAMERLYRSLGSPGFELVAVSVDTDPEAVRAFRDRLALSFPIVLDPDRGVANAYQAFRFPESWLIDAQGTLVGRFIGPREWDAPAYVRQIRRLLEDAGEGPAEAG
jgi:peroxiredoxin